MIDNLEVDLPEENLSSPASYKKMTSGGISNNPKYDSIFGSTRNNATDSYLPIGLQAKAPDLEQKLASLRDRYDSILANRSILAPQFSPRELLEAYRKTLLDRLNVLAENRDKIADLLATFYDVLDPAISFPTIQQKMAQIGDGLIDLLSAEDAGNRLLDSMETDYFVWTSLNEGEAMENAVALQETKGKATSSSSRSLSKEKIEAGLVRLKTEEYQILQERLSFVRRSVETIGQLRELIKTINFNMQKIGDWLARAENGSR